MKTLMVLVMMLLSMTANAQVQKYRATYFSYKYIKDGNWTTWTAKEKINMLIVVDPDKMRMTVYSATTQVYDIINVLEQQHKDEDGDLTTKFVAIDQDGDQCDIWFVLRHDSPYLDIYINFLNIRWVYSIPLSNINTISL